VCLKFLFYVQEDNWGDNQWVKTWEHGEQNGKNGQLLIKRLSSNCFV
jgi:hypothetical protein